MAIKVIIIALFLVSVVGILALYAFKVAYHFQYVRLKNRKNQGVLSDFFSRNFSNKGDAQYWKEAFWIFPLLYAIVLDEPTEALNNIKRKIKRLNVAIYLVLMVALLIVVYAAKAFPEGIF
jgi:hypothetical protein